eukprot:211882_1
MPRNDPITVFYPSGPGSVRNTHGATNVVGSDTDARIIPSDSFWHKAREDITPDKDANTIPAYPLKAIDRPGTLPAIPHPFVAADFEKVREGKFAGTYHQSITYRYSPVVRYHSERFSAYIRDFLDQPILYPTDSDSEQLTFLDVFTRTLKNGAAHFRMVLCSDFLRDILGGFRPDHISFKTDWSEGSDLEQLFDDEDIPYFEQSQELGRYLMFPAQVQDTGMLPVLTASTDTDFSFDKNPNRFTCDLLAYDLVDEVLLDLTGRGLTDALEKRIVKVADAEYPIRDSTMNAIRMWKLRLPDRGYTVDEESCSEYTKPFVGAVHTSEPSCERALRGFLRAARGYYDSLKWMMVDDFKRAKASLKDWEKKDEEYKNAFEA